MTQELSAPDLHVWIDSTDADRYRGSWVAVDDYGQVLRQESSQELIEDQPGAGWLVFVPLSGAGIVVPARAAE
jgi:hypothetical protein